MNLPLQIYDFIGILIPGAIAAIIVKIEYPAWVVWQLDSSTTQLTILFVLSYTGGQLLQGSSRYVWKIISNIKKRRLLQNQHGQTNDSSQAALTATAAVGAARETCGRHYTLAASQPFENELKKAFKNTFDIEIYDIDREEAFALMFSCAHDRMGQRPIFVAIANLGRCLASLLLMYIFFLIMKLFYILIRPDMVLFVAQTLWLFILLVFSLVFAVKNVDYFKQMSDQIPFAAFLSWYKEKQMGVRTRN